MSLAIVHSRAQVGVEAPAVTVEAHLANGLPTLTLVGLPEGAVKESKDRVRSAILNSGLDFPARRITLNLAPADLPKDGGRFDLAIALGLLGASGQLPLLALQEVECLGELALSGAIRSIQGVLPAALAARAAERTLIVPAANAEEACLASGLRVIAVNHLLELVAHFNGRTPIPPYQSSGLLHQPKPYPDLSEVQGQTAAKRALVVAAAGAHNLLFSGPPGTGKTLLASRLPGLLPPLDEYEALEVAAIQSVASQVPLSSWPQRPFRQPHHSASGPALVGGGSRPQPGEITLAHHGVLFLDELPEFDRRVLEVLREPLESGHIVISRARDRVRFPARFQLVAAMNPCPCGYMGEPTGRCRCSTEQIQRYRNKLSGPLLDRIDLHLTVAREATALNPTPQTGDNTASAAALVAKARDRQQRRQGCANAFLDLPGLREHCPLSAADENWLETACERLTLSLRAAHRLLKVARTLADLEQEDAIDRRHLAEALQYRPSSN
ncbi:YifB family Mg chelatase-like AAA ATPase [Pseudomonas lijiangensis]|uniref:YifB family Mg chelatase-like AAA ATPase n=1 Tax=Pseudomonas lijiangensis TaxID=2995658 RepID=A0ABX8HSJ8_9PSED|nr:YifB family Mg chelatase-like AAA ATPase [Pseudomonas lijiangensis]MBX8551282.1 YifB family Mg chelatase-like AAA ATPase [Pseudomonas cichorii]MBX8502489.1 YifB family Mg chelatase-like AAA ATPase [Pseudomonas lijiangensis]MBX8507437.1 YifB family Mg chelatase-like AAA ATPase [Pseudomonas lijiangensis]MBX8583322.1 YifB family Mg chelatase-like AAA ATPase [Pseudomonas cichorii]QWU83392.1 YifB family Mg chelatase-like AAA ATPase [Pseudomonas lijiangensis]